MSTDEQTMMNCARATVVTTRLSNDLYLHIYYDSDGAIEEVRESSLWQRLMIRSMFSTRPGVIRYRKSGIDKHMRYENGQPTDEVGILGFGKSGKLVFEAVEILKQGVRESRKSHPNSLIQRGVPVHNEFY